MATFLSSNGYTHVYVDCLGTTVYKNIDHLVNTVHHFRYECYHIDENKLFIDDLLIDVNDSYTLADYISGSFNSNIIIICIQEKIYYIQAKVINREKSKLTFLCDKHDNFVCRHNSYCIIFNGKYLYKLHTTGSSIHVDKYRLKDLTFNGQVIYMGTNKIYSDFFKIKFLDSDKEIIVDGFVTWVKLNKYIYLSATSAKTIESNGKNVLIRDRSAIVTDNCGTIPVPHDAELYYPCRKVKSARSVSNFL
jgi:hypothetical protein